jgi:hypothetical protein
VKADMIRYALRCKDEHRFEAWFSSSGDFDRLKAAGHVTCAVCGAGGVEKELMAPSLSAATKASPEPAAPEPAPPAPEHPLARLRRRIEAEAENVGRDFAREARRIHAGEAPERPIWGEARPAEARALLEDGIPVAPLPLPPAKAH